MRYLIISDLHSNLEALQAVLAASDGAYEKVICCGDLVGYGADPNAVVEWCRGHITLAVRGNHDKVCCGIADTSDFSELARLSAYWTRNQLTPENRQYLEDLPQGPHAVGSQFAILHGSPRDEDEYLPTVWAAARAFDFLKHRLSFFGHTHLQGGFTKSRARVQQIELNQITKSASSKRKSSAMLEIQAGETYLLNPGAVGQPRDRDNRAAFAIYDTDGLVEYGRVHYDIDAAMQKILQAGLPDFLAYRLVVGR